MGVGGGFKQEDWVGSVGRRRRRREGSEGEIVGGGQ